MGSLYLDSRNRLICEDEILRGTINRAAAEPRAILKRGLLVAAAGVILFHTHPSGDPSPSGGGHRLHEAGWPKPATSSACALVDHLVLGSATKWGSLKQRGEM